MGRFEEIWVVMELVFDRRGLSVPGIDDRFLRQKEKLSKRRKDVLFVSKGQIGPSYREMEESVATKESLFLWAIEAKASGGMKRGIDDMDFGFAKAEHFLPFKLIKFFFIEGLPFASELEGKIVFRVGKKRYVFGGYENGAFAFECGQTSDVVDMAVRDENALNFAVMMLLKIVIKKRSVLVPGIDYQRRFPFVAKDVGVAGVIGTVMEADDLNSHKKIRPKPYLHSL